MNLFGFNIARNQVEDPASQTNEDGMVKVPLTVGQVHDALSGMGDDIMGGFYKPYFYGRNQAICLTTLARAVMLISDLTAMLLGCGHYRIVDDMGNLDDSPRAAAFRRMFAHTLNGREPASTTIANLMADLLLEGNFVAVIEKDSGGRLKGLHRALPWSARVSKRTNLEDIYSVIDEKWNDGKLRDVPSKNIVHGKIVHLQRYGYTNGTRAEFAFAPIYMLRPNAEAGLALDEYILKFAKRGRQQALQVDHSLNDAGKPPTPEQMKEIQKHIQKAQKLESAVIQTINASMHDVTAKIDPNLMNYADRQANEIGKFFGLPPVLLGSTVTNWGQGIGELGRMARNYCFAIWIQRFADAVAFKMLPPGCHIVIDYSKIMASDGKDLKDRMDALRGDAQRPGVATLDEMRRIADLPMEYNPEDIPQTIQPADPNADSMNEEESDSDEDDS